jgi:putative peptide zinc metalloprotease protein
MLTRNQAISGVPWLSGLPSELIDLIAKDLIEEEYPADSIIFRQGEAGDRLAIIVSGKAEVSVLDAKETPLVVATLEPGDSFGELALLQPGGRRNATVTARKRLLLLTLKSDLFERLLGEEPGIRPAIEQMADQIELANFLKMCTPFTSLGPKVIRSMGERVEHLDIPEGKVIIQQGESGNTCYLIRTGKVEVTLAEDGVKRRLATLGPGTLFGEAALLTEAPRNATVRAIEPSTLLSLDRPTLLQALAAEQQVAQKLSEMLQMRGRPRQALGVEVHTRQLPDGDTVYLLKNPRLGTYFRLSCRGWFLWCQLNGKNGMRELATGYFLEFKSFDPFTITQTLGGLAAAGFLEGVYLSRNTALSLVRMKWWQRVLLAARSMLEVKWTLRNVDTWFKRLYDGGVKYLYAPSSLILMAVIAITGVIAFFVGASKGLAALGADPKLRWFMIPAMLLATALHEMGHAFTTVRSGRHVNGVGVGWFWFGPVAFVDTSDMWLGEKWERIAVTAAGPATNLFLAGAASLLVFVVSSTAAAAALWQFAWLNYLIFAFNLNPLIELDGYYLLMDWLERPNFRSKTLAWIGQELPKALRVPGALRAHRTELIYGGASVLYVGIMSAAVAISVHRFIQGWLSRWVSAATGEYSAIVLAMLLFAFFLARVAGDFRGAGGETS